MSNVLGSRKVRAVLWILGGLIALFVAFGLGVTVGYERAGFAAGFDKNYTRIFFGSGGGVAGGYATSVPSGTQVMGAAPMAVPMQAPVVIHGVVGRVIDAGTSTLSVEDQQGNERSVAVSPATDIRNGNTEATIVDVADGDIIAVIGEPNSEGQIDAHFIRIFSQPSQ